MKTLEMLENAIIDEMRKEEFKLPLVAKLDWLDWISIIRKHIQCSEEVAASFLRRVEAYKIIRMYTTGNGEMYWTFRNK